MSEMVPLIAYRMTGGWTDWFAPEVLPYLLAQFLPFLFVPPLLIAAACLWKWRGEAAKSCLRGAVVFFVVGVVWQLLAL